MCDPFRVSRCRKDHGKRENDRVIGSVAPVSGVFGEMAKFRRSVTSLNRPVAQELDDTGAHLIFFDLPVHTICTHGLLEV
jgi:hypothetical protein